MSDWLGQGLAQELYLPTYRVIATSPPVAPLEICATLGFPPVDVVVVDGASNILPVVDSGEIVIEPSTFIRGDCNVDATIDLSDPIGLANFLFAGALRPGCASSCDGNDDGVLDLADVIFVLQFLFTQGAAPPSPWPDCGEDPTVDMLGCGSPLTCP